MGLVQVVEEVAEISIVRTTQTTEHREVLYVQGVELRLEMLNGRCNEIVHRVDASVRAQESPGQGPCRICQLHRHFQPTKRVEQPERLETFVVSHPGQDFRSHRRDAPQLVARTSCLGKESMGPFFTSEVVDENGRVHDDLHLDE